MNPTLTLFRFGRGHRFWWNAQLDRITRAIAGWFAHPAPVPVRAPRTWLPVLFAIALLGGASSGAHAQAWRRDDLGILPFSSDRIANGELVDVQMLVRGQPAPLYMRRGVDRWYFQAFRGRDYAIRVHNNTGERVGVLIAVDGLNVVNGERTGLSADEPMYVLDPWESATIRGWRTSDRDVRKFVFVDEERSYANRTDQANGDMGWIRVMAFREFRPQVWTAPRYRDDLRGGAPPSGAPQALPFQGKSQAQKEMSQLAPPDEQGNPGTGWGERRYDPVRRVWFQPESAPSDQLVLRYEYESGLRALGIFPGQRDRTWDRERGEFGYAQPPRW